MTQTLTLCAVLSLAVLTTAGTASAQCLSVGSGAGDAIVSCQNGQTGYIHVDPTGAVSGMAGAQPFAPAIGQVSPTPGVMNAGRPQASYLDPGVAAGLSTPYAAPSLPAPVLSLPTPEARPWSTYSDPAAAGLTAPVGR